MAVEELVRQLSVQDLDDLISNGRKKGPERRGQGIQHPQHGRELRGAGAGSSRDVVSREYRPGYRAGSQPDKECFRTSPLRDAHGSLHLAISREMVRFLALTGCSPTTRGFPMVQYALYSVCEHEEFRVALSSRCSRVQSRRPVPLSARDTYRSILSQTLVTRPPSLYQFYDYRMFRKPCYHRTTTPGVSKSVASLHAGRNPKVGLTVGLGAAQNIRTRILAVRVRIADAGDTKPRLHAE